MCWSEPEELIGAASRFFCNGKCCTHWQGHEHGVLRGVSALVVSQLIRAAKAVLLLRGVVPQLVPRASWRPRQQHVARVAYIGAPQLALHG